MVVLLTLLPYLQSLFIFHFVFWVIQLEILQSNNSGLNVVKPQYKITEQCSDDEFIKLRISIHFSLSVWKAEFFRQNTN